MFSQQNYGNHFEYLSPLPNSAYVSPENTFAFRLNYDRRTALKDISITLKGDKSNIIQCEAVKALDQKTFIFKPSKPFQAGETVEVVVKNNAPKNKY